MQTIVFFPEGRFADGKIGFFNLMTKSRLPGKKVENKPYIYEVYRFSLTINLILSPNLKEDGPGIKKNIRDAELAER